MVNEHMRSFFNHIFSRLFIFFVLFYRCTLAHIMGGHCRFQPTCSQYMIDAINKYGPFRGAYRGIKRILRCHPFSKRSGYDPA
ncbi:membrane protein insertion efficiency factor YidD [Poriferisphaera sp. WC338]|uniref:membrane protein insertion efficiency factor YidD n=1 Tax=Poriferisphaera sp. WC338 TaxID=3425129 RepID=UPI003D81B422